MSGPRDDTAADLSGWTVTRSVACWLLLLAGTAGVSVVAATGDLLDADAARVRRETLQRSVDALQDEREQWQAIETALRTDPRFRAEWTRRELAGLVARPDGLPLDETLAVDPRRPQPVTVDLVAFAPWRPLVTQLHEPGRLRFAVLVVSFASLLIGLLGATPSLWDARPARV